MKLIVVDGPDNAGKTTLIDELTACVGFEKLNFPKRTEQGRFTIASRNEVAIFETMLEHLDPSKIYVIDRGYISNLVYYKFRKEFGIDLMDCEKTENFDEDDYVNDIQRLKENHDVLYLTLTRDKLNADFEDDLISLTKDEFNRIIELFEQETAYAGGVKHKILTHNAQNEVIDAERLTPKHRIFMIIESYFRESFWEYI